jgi:hypothetical protein
VTTTATKTVEARAKQREASKSATLEKLIGKKRASTTFKIWIDQDEVEMTFRAIGAMEYDRLVSKHPPTTEQRADGASFNLDTFAPALISAVSSDPEISPTDAKEIWNSAEWSRGEVITLYRQAVDLCNRGLDIPFNENGSG